MARRGYSASCGGSGAVALLVTALIGVPTTCAALFDRGFESGTLAGWQATGSVSIVTSAFGDGPTQGTYQALLTNGADAAPIETLESFIGVSAGTLSGLGNGSVTDGSALKQTLIAAAGSSLSFDWDFLTDELPSSAYNDFAFVTISGVTSTLANTHASFILPVAPFQHETGFQSFTYVTPANGTYTIAIGVVNVLDTVGESALLVDNFTLTTSVCGNGVLDFGEQCDDNNRTPGDGCDDECQIEPCHTCAGQPSACSPSPDGTACDDEDFCNGTDMCSGGACSVHSGDPCAGGVECNNVCNEMRNTCLVPTGVACTDDGNTCTFDVCDGTGVCTHPNDDFIVCDDGVFCNGADLCRGGSCSLHAGDPCRFAGCTTVCDEATATCDPSAAGTPCFDDANVCTLDQCDGTGACVHRPVPDGTTCNDANACTRTDTCQSGVCVGGDPVVCAQVLCHGLTVCDPTTGMCTGQMPVMEGCRQAAQSRFSYVNSATDAKDRVQWKWDHGAQTTRADFGDPTTSANYQFCVFAETSNAAALLLGAEVPANASAWTPIGMVGYKYLDKTASQDGISQILVRGGAAGRSKIILRGKGTELSDPMPIAPIDAIRVQLTNESTGICWESELPVSAIGGNIHGSAP